MRAQRQGSIGGGKRKSGLREAIREAEEGFGMPQVTISTTVKPMQASEDGDVPRQPMSEARRQELKEQVGNAQKNREALLREAAMSAAMTAGMYGSGPAVTRPNAEPYPYSRSTRTSEN